MLDRKKELLETTEKKFKLKFKEDFILDMKFLGPVLKVLLMELPYFKAIWS
jgi:hypothetical protein